ncbi:MAG TPA: family 20 glycosylhydrolase [Bacteroidota bacterium]|nr:family 20 glycosylhydrolase [Bacteroidota bacterium]
MQRTRALYALLLLLTAALPVSPARAVGKEVLSLVPEPVSIREMPGKFIIGPHTSVIVHRDMPAFRDVARFLAARLRESTGYPVPVDSAATRIDPDEICFVTATIPGGDEGYNLQVSPRGILISAQAPAGAFYAMQTLFQLMPPELAYGTPVQGVVWAVPGVLIDDAPRFSWRGMHLDVGRHFFGKKFVEEYIDLLSRYKFNVFHWHLTDDQGWRIEIKKYPRLTSVGSWRKETLGDGQPEGGYYTQDEIREVVAYARERFITIVPEIEMPGHSTAALAAYPELSCTGGPFDVQTKWRVFEDVYCAGNDKTFEFLDDVLTEVMALFPGPYIHIGGDECPKTRWKVCPKCQARIRAENLADEHELQSYFVKRIEKFLNAHGRRLVGWDEILEGGLAPNATVMSWRGIDGGVKAAASGHDVVMTPTSNCYFDYTQGVTGEPWSVGAYLPLEKVYAYEPVPPGLTPDQARHILGAQGNVWTEWIAGVHDVEYMAFPRACAMSEVDWTPAGKKDFRDFSARMAGQYARFVAGGVNARIPAPTGFEGNALFTHDTTLAIASQVPGSVMRYTLDGTEPTAASPEVTAPVVLRASTTVKARTFLPSGGTSVVPFGVFSRIDPAVNGVTYSIVRRRAPADTIRGATYVMSLDSLPLPPDSATVTLDALVDLAAPGVYTFTIAQGDSVSLAVDAFPAVNNRAPDWWDLPATRYALGRGAHRLRVAVAAAKRPSALVLQLEGPGLERRAIPASLLRRQPH